MSQVGRPNNVSAIQYHNKDHTKQPHVTVSLKIFL